MRLIQSETQTPKKLVVLDDRNRPVFIVLLAGVGIVAIGAAIFFLAFIMRNYIAEYWTIPFRTLQSYGFLVVFVGIGIYSVCAKILNIPLRNTSFYKLTTIIRDESYDPPRKDDYTKQISDRLRFLSDEWFMSTQVNPPDAANYLIPQVIAGPGGVFATWPLTVHPGRKEFRDPGPLLEKACRLLGGTIGTTVIPILVFSASRVVDAYKKKYLPTTRLLSLMELDDFFKESKRRLNIEQVADIKEKIFPLIKGTAPGEKFLP